MSESKGPLRVFYHGSGWEWQVLLVEEGSLGSPDAVYYGIVYSPLAPNGEHGQFTQAELNEVGARMLPEEQIENARPPASG